MSDNISEKSKNNQQNRKPGLPFQLSFALRNAEQNNRIVQENLVKLNLKNFDDAIALSNIVKVFENSTKIKQERFEKSRNKKNIFNISAEYHVLGTNSNLTKKLFKIIGSLENLQTKDMSNIHENFLKSNFENVKDIIDGNKDLIDEVDNTLTIIGKVLTDKSSTGKYEKNKILDSLISNYSDEELQAILDSRKSEKKAS